MNGGAEGGGAGFEGFETGAGGWQPDADAVGIPCDRPGLVGDDDVVFGLGILETNSRRFQRIEMKARP